MILSTSAHKSDEGCCLNQNKYVDFVSAANYNCKQLEPFGEERCNSVYNGQVCKWYTGKKCDSHVKCSRVPFYEQHYGKVIDVGRCIGKCSLDRNTCSIKDYYYLEVDKIDNYIEGNNQDLMKNLPDTNEQQLFVRIVKNCVCDTCDVEQETRNIKVSLGKCVGNCSRQEDTLFMAGNEDSFSQINGNEPSFPSNALITNYLSQCSAGIQSGFDIFANDRCFGHTFTNVIERGDCAVRRALLRTCLKAANVFLTHTDSLSLGFNGVSVWGKSLVSLNGGHWNQGDSMCLTMNLASLPIDGLNILPQLESIGHLDFAVQDDTAVDFLSLDILYEKCQRCLPSVTSINGYYSNQGLQLFKDVEKCDCVNLNECKRHSHIVIYNAGTLFEKHVDVGICMGKCNVKGRCVPKEVSELSVIMLDVKKPVNVIESCTCNPYVWNGNAELLHDNRID